MSVLGDVFGTLRTMSQLQLLLAFMACTGYAVAQGALVSAKARRIAAGTALLSVTGFAIESTQWTYAAMLATFAVAGLGLFIAATWLVSRFLGLSEPRALVEFVDPTQAAEASPVAAPAQPSMLALPQPGGAAHSA
jgi:hypothetical protein